jgi:hypothetical protein
MESALQYFDELTTRLKLCQGVPKVVSGVEENEKVVSDSALYSHLTPAINNEILTKSRK